HFFLNGDLLDSMGAKNENLSFSTNGFYILLNCHATLSNKIFNFAAKLLLLTSNIIQALVSNLLPHGIRNFNLAVSYQTVQKLLVNVSLNLLLLGAKKHFLHAVAKFGYIFSVESLCKLIIKLR